MGKAATAFKDIGKACSDLLTKDFKTGQTKVEVKSTASNGVTFTPITTKAGDSFSGSLAAKGVRQDGGGGDAQHGRRRRAAA